MKSAGTLKYIIIDAENPALLADFWSKVIGQPIEKSFGPFTKLKSPEYGPTITIQKVPDRTKAKSNVHFDLQTDNLDASEFYIVSLGGRLFETHRSGKWEWRIMADPEGNLFCLVMQ